MDSTNQTQAPPTLPSAPAPPPMFGQQNPNQKKKPKKKPEAAPSFLGTEQGANPTNTGTNTLLGQ